MYNNARDKYSRFRITCNELITDLITLTLILKDTVKTEKILSLEIKNKLKKLEQKKINELNLLEEEIFFMTLRDMHLGRSSQVIKEEEIELKEKAKRRIDEIEELKEDVEWESKAAKMLQDLNYEKNDEIAAIAEIEQNLIKSGISKELIKFFKKINYSKKILSSCFRITAKEIHNA